ncbi:UNVERIFIED_CONTAM: hypothetical protein Slati_3228100 [Sesamum latifolium]|uniref:Uncharacterized protein n=1 Tax=Sesamum latifolium TaxID=2727402 RepID=A0AAW2UYA3_9LAMI
MAGSWKMLLALCLISSLLLSHASAAADHAASGWLMPAVRPAAGEPSQSASPTKMRSSSWIRSPTGAS